MMIAETKNAFTRYLFAAGWGSTLPGVEKRGHLSTDSVNEN